MIKKWLLFGFTTMLLLCHFQSSEAQSKYNELELTGDVLIVETLSQSQGKLDQIPQKFVFTKSHEMVLMINFSPNKVSGFAYDKLERPLFSFQDQFENVTGEFSYDLDKKTFIYTQGKTLMSAGKLNQEGRIISLTTAVKDNEEEKDVSLKLKDKKQSKQTRLLEYDSKGNQTLEQTLIEINGTPESLFKLDMVYNEQNQKIFETRERADRKNIINERTFLYDHQGFLIEIKGVNQTKDGKEDLGSFTLVYDQVDEKGNWLKRRTFFQEQEIHTETRTIQYHE